MNRPVGTVQQWIEALWAEGQDDVQIAELIGMPVNTVQHHLFRSKAGRANRRGERAMTPAEKYASVYPDDERRAWITRQMQRWQSGQEGRERG